MTATPQIPDGFSSDDLQVLLENAVSEETAQAESAASKDGPYSEMSIVDCAHKHLNAMTDEINDPIVHKAAIIQILTNMIGWHTQVALNKIAEDDTECATGWMRDAGKFQAMLDIITSISLGANDPWLRH